MDGQLLGTATELLAIALSIVALTVTIIGFFASLKFYRDGVELQANANTALARIDEKAQSIQTQVGSMFDKTLDAAIGQRGELASQFQAVNDQMETAAQHIQQSVLEQVGAAGENERTRIAEEVDQQLQLVRDRLTETRETTEVLESTGAHGRARFWELITAQAMKILVDGPPAGMELAELGQHLKISPTSTAHIVSDLASRSLVTLERDNQLVRPSRGLWSPKRWGGPGPSSEPEPGG